jgi:7-carboxy-7-deazaguanine synthase
MLYYQEVFKSIQGESIDSGLPFTFVRLYGCNLHCGYCDQPQNPCDRKRISVENLIEEVKKLKVPHVCITGGEPLTQPEAYTLIYELVKLNYYVTVETNGAVVIDPDNYIRAFRYIMDIKCPSSGMSEHNLYDNLAVLHPQDEVKFVIADRKDYDFMLEVIKSYPTKARILVSPMFDKDMKPVIGKELVQWVLEDKLHKVRVQIQLHKIIGVL